jgi:sporadic carbohydrate cluster protein (TIGR04323 family)
VTKPRLGYRGYVTSREFGGARIPVPVQALVLRDYCARKELLYKLHVNENVFPNSYLVLDSLVSNLDGLEGVLMCSMYMLPKRAARRQALYDHIFRQGVSMHFVLEEIVVTRPSDTIFVEEILAISEALPLCPTEIMDDSSAGSGRSPE